MKSLKLLLLGVCLCWIGTGFAMKAEEKFKDEELQDMLQEALIKNTLPIIRELDEAITQNSKKDFATDALNSIKMLIKQYLPNATADNKQKGILLMTINHIKEWIKNKLENNTTMSDYSKEQLGLLKQELEKYYTQFEAKKLLSKELIEQDASSVQIAPKKPGKIIPKKK